VSQSQAERLIWWNKTSRVR